MKKFENTASEQPEGSATNEATLYRLTSCLQSSDTIQSRIGEFVEALTDFLPDTNLRVFLYQTEQLPTDLKLTAQYILDDDHTVYMSDALRDLPRIHWDRWTDFSDNDSDLGIQQLFRDHNNTIRSAAVVPLSHNQTAHGCLIVSRSSDEAFTDREREICLKACNHLGFSISQASTLETALKREERFALAVHGSDDGLWDWNLRTNQIHLSARFQTMLGHPSIPVEVDPSAFLAQIHPDDVDGVQDALIAHKSGVTRQFVSEHRMLHKDGMYRWVICRAKSVVNPKGTRVRVVGIQTDITDRRNAYDQLVHDAFHDTLTHLPNRALFTNRLNQAFARGNSAEGHRFAVMSISLDRFKALNDALGYETGDRLLKEMSQRLMACMTEMDTVARLERDQFAVLLGENADIFDPVRSASRIQEAIEGPMEIDGNHISITTSIGVNTNESEYTDPEAILRDAQTAMYRATGNGQNQICHFDPTFHELALTQLQLELDLRQAVSRDELFLEYQPIYSFDEGCVVGVEALLRWNHPTLGRLLPGKFITTAEETGLIVPIGEWVLREACRQAAEWESSLERNFPFFMSINLAPEQLSDPAFGRILQSTLRETGVTPSKIKLEITERMLLAENATVREALHQIRALGAHLSIDDFGTGYSALSYLMDFEMDELKLDRSFVQGLANDSQRQKVVGAVVTLAHSLGMSVTAEGIEQESERLIVKRIGCDLAQGYLFGRPLEASIAFKSLNSSSQKKISKVVKLPSM